MKVRRHWVLAYAVYALCAITELLRANIDTESVAVVCLLTVVAWCLWIAVYVFRVWLMLAAMWLMLAFTASVTTLVLISVCGAGVALWYAFAIAQTYIKDFLSTAEARRPHQRELLRGCSYIPAYPQETLVILTASDGFGHLAAARIWSDRLRASHPNASIYCLDVFDFMGEWSWGIFRGWEFFAMYIPELHALAHRVAIWDMKSWTRRVAQLIAEQVRQEVGEEVTEVVACHPIAAAAATNLKKYTWRNTRVTVACTDFFINPHAFDPGNEEYRLPGDLIPLGRKILPEERKTARARLGLSPDSPAILVAMGGSGMLPPEKAYKLFRMLRFASQNLVGYQFVLACGTNTGLAEEARKYFQELPRVLVMQRSESLRTILDCFDGFLGKPGGLTCTDAIQAGIPFAIWYAWRGQERRNLKYLRAAGLGMDVQNGKRTVLRWLVNLRVHA